MVGFFCKSKCEYLRKKGPISQKLKQKYKRLICQY